MYQRDIAILKPTPADNSFFCDGIRLNKTLCLFSQPINQLILVENVIWANKTSLRKETFFVFIERYVSRLAIVDTWLEYNL